MMPLSLLTSLSALPMHRHRIGFLWLALLGPALLAGCEPDREAIWMSYEPHPDRDEGYCVSLAGRIHGHYLLEVNGYPEWDSGGAPVSYAVGCYGYERSQVRGVNLVRVSLSPLAYRAGEEVIFAGAPPTSVSVYDLEDRQKRVDHVSEADVASAYGQWLPHAEAAWGRALAWERSWLAEDPARAALVSGGVRGEGGALDSLRSWVRAHPMVFEVVFEAERGPDAGWLLGRAKRRAEVGEAERLPWERRYRMVGGARALPGTAADSARLRGYAIELREALRERDTLGVFELTRARHQSAAYTPSQIDTLRERVLPQIPRDWFAEPPRSDYEAEDIGLRRWAGGRVWEVYRTDEQRVRALMLAGEESIRWFIPFYVAEVDGTLRRVR